MCISRQMGGHLAPTCQNLTQGPPSEGKEPPGPLFMSHDHSATDLLHCWGQQHQLLHHLLLLFLLNY